MTGFQTRPGMLVPFVVAGLFMHGGAQRAGLAQQSSPGILLDDFNDGVEDGWTERDYTAGEPYGPSTLEIRDGKYHLCNAVVGCDGELHDAELIDGLQAFRDGTDGLYFANGYLRAKVRADTNSTLPALLLRAGGSPENLVGYSYWGSSRFGNIAISRWEENGASTQLVPVASVGFFADQDWYFEAGAVGDALTFKAWRADSEEPLEPQLTRRDRRYRSGAIALESNQTASGPNQPFGASFDDVVWINPGDIDVDGDLDADDIDSLSAAVLLGSDEPIFDVDRDGAVNQDDRQLWVQWIHDTSFGDTNLDGVVDSTDIDLLLTGAGEPGGWSDGDFNGDEMVGDADAFIWRQNTRLVALNQGDYNLDGRVSAADYTVWRDRLLSTTDLRADGNADGVVNQADYDLWRQNYGSSTSASIQAVVPEPTAAMLACVASSLIGIWRSITLAGRCHN